MRKNYFLFVFGVTIILIGVILFIVTVSVFPIKTDTANTEKRNSTVESVDINGTEEESKTEEASEYEEAEQIEEIIPEEKPIEEAEPIEEIISETEPIEEETSEVETVTEETEQTEEPEITEEEVQTEEPEFSEGTERFADTSLWNLILVNQDNYLPEGFEIETAYVQGNYDMDSRAAPYAIQMIADAKADGIELQLCSAYRALELQKRLFNNKINEFLVLGHSYSLAEREASAIVAIPGTSEHQTGLALDIVTPSYQRLNAGYEDTDAAKWLKENAWKYGFILRFPKDKTEITKIMFEPWHYRYVGTEYSEFIMKNGLCLEEFLEQYGY